MKMTNSLSYHPLVNVLVTSQRPLLMQVPRHCSIKTVKLNPHPQGNYLLFSSEMENNQSVNNYEAVVNVNEISPPPSPSNNGEVPSKVIRIHSSLVRADMLKILSDPSIFSHATMMRCLTFCQHLTVREKSHTAI